MAEDKLVKIQSVSPELNEAQLIRELKDRINQLKRIKYKNQTAEELDERNRKRRDYQQKKRDEAFENRDFVCKDCNTMYSGLSEQKRHNKTIGHQRRAALSQGAPFFTPRVTA